MSIKERSHAVSPAEVGRLDSLVAHLLAWPRSRVRGLLAHGGVTVNGEAASRGESGGRLLQAGDQLHLRYDPERKYREPAAERATSGFDLIYSDDSLVVVRKDAGLLTVPTDRRESKTLINLLSNHLGKGQRRAGRAYIVHRLDREVSGLLVFGRSQAMADALSAQFAARKPEREYAAIVAGSVAQDSGELRSMLLSDRDLKQKSVAAAPIALPGRGGKARQPKPPGELAITHYTVDKRWRDATLLRIRLETGRRNQIRVHMAEMGHPILGDAKYAPAPSERTDWPYTRLALHARILGFRHPVSSMPLRFELPLPAEFARFLINHNTHN